MRCITIPLVQTGQVHKISQDYLNHTPHEHQLYDYSPDMQGLDEAIAARQQKPVNRQALADALTRQYETMEPGFAANPDNAAVLASISSLKNENTFTLTAGHQLNIFTGPLYYIYKLVSVIKYAELLKQRHPDKHFVPVYWMATEDHDFEEINHFWLWGKKFEWTAEAAGPVGRMSPAGLEAITDELAQRTTNSPFGAELIALLQKAYTQPVMATAVRTLVHGLFKQYGLVVLDADDAALKQELVPVLKHDILEQKPYHAFTSAAATAMLEQCYKLPVSPREINVFYMQPGQRTRIVKTADGFEALDTDKKWSRDEMAAEIEAQPENFSPNVVLRPVYQELILPNLAYVGGNGEIAYWLELRSIFKALDVFYPQLLLRDSALIIGKKGAKELETLKLRSEDLFLKYDDLKFRFYENNDMVHPAEQDATELAGLYEKLRKDMQGLPNDLVANIVKQMNLHVKEVRKWKNDIHASQMELQEKNIGKLEKLYQSLFPDGGLQERHDNFITYYLAYGPQWFEMLKEAFNPTDATCKVFVEE